jgi:hypothetical protein
MNILQAIQIAIENKQEYIISVNGFECGHNTVYAPGKVHIEFLLSNLHKLPRRYLLNDRHWEPTAPELTREYVAAQFHEATCVWGGPPHRDQINEYLADVKEELLNSLFPINSEKLK